MRHERRDFMKMAGIGGVVFASGLFPATHAADVAGKGATGASAAEDFHFVQLSDCHWGFEGPPNPDAKGTLKKAVASVNGLAARSWA